MKNMSKSVNQILNQMLEDFPDLTGMKSVWLEFTPENSTKINRFRNRYIIYPNKYGYQHNGKIEWFLIDNDYFKDGVQIKTGGRGHSILFDKSSNVLQISTTEHTFTASDEFTEEHDVKYHPWRIIANSESQE